jgi:hypothetical protein
MGNNDLENDTCAYKDCTNLATVRMNFPMDFSALFCPTCAAALQKKEIAAMATRSNHRHKDIKNKIDVTSTSTSIESSPNKKVLENG